MNRIEVDVARPAARSLVLSFALSGRTTEIDIPPPVAPTRTDELWRRTCFEAFIRTADSNAYYEFNFSPSTQWAAYEFAGYREGMSAADVAQPRIEARAQGERLVLNVSLDLESVAALPIDGPWRLGLSAVIEEADGRKSYWALAHPPGKPDFHHPDCFALELRAPQPS